MTKYRRRKFLEESNGASGEYPEHGAIFMSNSSTRKECLRRELFGLPMGQAGFVKQVKAGMFLFLFEFESRELHGVFQACSDGAINIEPDAFCSSGKQFPAQVKFTEKWRCRPLGEMEFRHAISDNYFTAKKFNFGLSKAQVRKLLKLFSLKKVERPKRTRKIDSRLGNAAGDRGFRNRRAEETERDVDHEFPLRGTYARYIPGRRLSENYGHRDDSESGVKNEESEYSRDASGVFRRLVDPKLHGFEDRYDMKNSSRTDDDSDYSLVNGRNVLTSLSHPASVWLEKEYREREGFTHENSREEHLTLEEDSAVPAQSSVPSESAYGLNTEYYDPCNPGIMGGAAMESSRHDIDEEPDYYIPMPTEHPEYQTSTGMAGASCSEYESGYGHLHPSQLPGFLASAGDTENMTMSSERLPYPSRSIFPSFAYPSSPTDLSPNDGVNYKIAAYQHQEELGGHASYSNDRVARDSRIYPSFAYPSKQGDGVDLYQENRTQNKVQAYQQHLNEFAGEAFDSDKRVIRMKESVSPAEPERKRARKSVFSRLVMPSKERDAQKESSPVAEPVDEVMAFLNDCQKHLMEQKRPKTTGPAWFGKSKKRKEMTHNTKEVPDNGVMLPLSETSPDDQLDSEERVEHSDQKQPFIDFKRRSQAEKSSGNPTQECKDSLKDSAPQDKKRKLLRPKLTEDDSKKDIGNSDNPIENDTAPKLASEVPLLDLFARFGQ